MLDLHSCGVPAACWARFRRWVAPPNWSRQEWWLEVVAQAQAAAWQAMSDHSPARDGPLEHYIGRRVLASVLRHYRQEWHYVCFCGGQFLCAPDDDQARRTLDDIAAPENCFPDVDLCEAISLLCPEDQRLIHALFWEGHSEAEVAQAWGLSQPAVSKRKAQALGHLRDLLATGETG